MRLFEDQKTSERCQLLFDVCPAFISAAERIVSEYLNSVTIMVNEIRMIPKIFREEHTTYDLPISNFQECEEHIESILCQFESLVDDAIDSCAGVVSQDAGLSEWFPKLIALRSLIVNDGPYRSMTPQEECIQMAAQHISYGKTPAQFGLSISTARNFNHNIQAIFAEKKETRDDETHGFFPGNLAEDLEKSAYQAQRFVKASKELYKHLGDSPCSSTMKPHFAHIHLTGFEEPRFDMILPICVKGNKLNGSKHWQQVYFSQFDPSENASQQSLIHELCTELNLKALRTRKASSMLFNEKGIYSSSLSETLPRRSKPVKPPVSTISHILDKKAPVEDNTKTPVQTSTYSQRAIIQIDKVKLGTTIASSLIFLHGTPFLQTAWNTETIRIAHGQSNEAEIEAPFLAPYITCDFDPMSLQNSVSEDGIDEWNPFTLLLDLAKLLLKLEIDEEVVVEPGDIDEETEEPSLPMALDRIHRRLEKQSVSDAMYRGVIDTCLQMYYDFRDLDDENQYQKFRTEFLRRIVEPLKNRYEVLRDPGSFARRAMRAKIQHDSPRQHGVPKGNRWPLERFPKSAHLMKRPLVEVTEVEVEISAHDPDEIEARPIVEEDPSFLSSTGKIASSWLWVQRIDTLNATHMGDTVLPVAARKVKIAILDTGCDLNADCINMIPDAEERLEYHWRDEVAVGSPTPVDEDTSAVKHGTALVALLLRIAPHAELFVIRVAKSATELDNSNVAKGIIYAAEVWDVDMISMSFGFPEKQTEIDQAISTATAIKGERKKGILFFAAANNDGSNEKEMFPASHPAVISVRGTDHTGDFVSAYNPDVWPGKKGSMLFGTLGKDVPYDRGNKQAKLSGCSLATPVLVGITAIIIHYISCVSDNIGMDVFLSWEAISQVLQELSTDKGGGLRYVAPWDFFRQRDVEVRIAFIRSALGKLQPQSV